jgi:pimeloyl-ACP methyl ester carboxylesterase
MWHGAWCWEDWQKLFAEWGWESHSISQPGHGKSPVQRPIHKCTLDYYLAFLRDEAERLPRKPVILGHSMGGAITQWYLKYVGDIPAAVLVASWVRHSALWDGAPLLLSQDPSIFWRMMLSWDASSWVRNPRRAAEKLIGPKAPISPEELYARLGPESALVTFQHNPPIWSPPENLPIPTLWLAGELDTVVSVPGLRKSARIYGGDFVLVPEAGHNLMMEHNARQTAQTIHDWLVARAIP